VHIDGSWPGGVFFTNFVWDGNSSVWDTKFGGTSATCSGNAGAGNLCNPGTFANFLENPTTVQYFVIENAATSPFNPRAFSHIATTTIQYGYLKNWCSRLPNCHAEWWDGPGNFPNPPVGTALVKIDHVTISGDGTSAVSNSQFGPVGFYYSSNPPSEIDDLEWTNNTEINPYVGGYMRGSTNPVGTMSGCIGGAPTGGTSAAPSCDTSAPDNHFYVTAQTAPLGHGMVAFNGGCTYGALGIYQHIAGPYPTTSPAIIDEWSMDAAIAGGPAEYSPHFTATGSCSNATMKANVANNPIMAGRGGSLWINANIKNNMYDITSQAGWVGSPWYVGTVEGVVSGFSGTIATSGGVSKLTITSGTPSLAPTMSLNGSGIDGCSIDLGHCPQIASGANPTWVLSSPVTAIASPVPMSATFVSKCTNPVSLSGNFDAAKITPFSASNSLLRAATTFGC
jgi:hypothetical protein